MNGKRDTIASAIARGPRILRATEIEARALRRVFDRRRRRPRNWPRSPRSWRATGGDGPRS
jgi:hypothetical protein